MKTDPGAANLAADLRIEELEQCHSVIQSLDTGEYIALLIDLTARLETGATAVLVVRDDVIAINSLDLNLDQL